MSADTTAATTATAAAAAESQKEKGDGKGKKEKQAKGGDTIKTVKGMADWEPEQVRDRTHMNCDIFFIF
jgi:hypothetical protein